MTMFGSGTGSMASRTLGPRREDAPTSRDRFDPANPMTDAQIDQWIKATPHKVMYREESRID